MFFDTSVFFLSFLPYIYILNSEIFIFIVFFVLFLFILCKGISLKSLMLLYSSESINFPLFLLKKSINFFLFSFFVFFFVSVSLFDSRFFFFDFTFFSDNFIIIVKNLVFLSVLFIFLLFVDYFQFESILKSFESSILILLSVLGMFLLLSSNDFLSFYITLEFQSLALYILTALKQNSLYSIEAGLKYFILGTFASGLLLFGSSLIYGLTGTLNFFELNSLFEFGTILQFDYLFKLSILFFFSALFFKFSAAPLHMWSPDVYQGSPTILTFFFSITPKIVFLAVFARISLLLFSAFELYSQFLFFFCGLVSLILGSLSSIYQIKLKRLLAYSSIANVGYFLMGLSSGQLEGLASVFVYIFIYVVAISGIFSLLLGLRYFYNSFEFRNIFEVFGLLNINTFAANLFIISLFSLLGLPPFSGFIGKFYLFFASFGTELFLLLYVSILGSIFSAVIYLRVIRLVLFNKFNNIFFLKPFSLLVSLLGSFLGLLNLLIFFFSDNFFILFYNSIFSLYQTFLNFSFFF